MIKLELCKKCKKRKFELQRGIICGLTNEKPSFENNCPDFENDETVIEFKRSDLNPNNQRAKIALSMIGIVLGLEIISLVSSGFQYDLLQTVSNGGDVSYEAAEANDLREQIIGIIYIIAYIISGITFIMWFRRAYYNLHQKVNNLSYTDGWAAGSWFVPIVNLFRPYQIMKELYVESKRYIIGNDDSLQLDLNTNFVGIWWALWILAGVLGQIVYRLSLNAVTLSELTTVTILSMISGVIGIALGIVTLKVIRDYSKVEGLLGV